MERTVEPMQRRCQDPRTNTVNPATQSQQAMPPAITQAAKRNRLSNERERRLWRYRSRTSSVSAPDGGSVTRVVSAMWPVCLGGRNRVSNSGGSLDAPAGGIPESQARSESFGLRDHDRHVGQLHLTASLGRLVGHELPDPLEDRLLHRENLRVDVLPEQSLLQRRGVRISLAVHAQRVIATPRRGDDVGPVLGSLVRGHVLQIHPVA